MHWESAGVRQDDIFEVRRVTSPEGTLRAVTVLAVNQQMCRQLSYRQAILEPRHDAPQRRPSAGREQCPGMDGRAREGISSK